MTEQHREHSAARHLRLESFPSSSVSRSVHGIALFAKDEVAGHRARTSSVDASASKDLKLDSLYIVELLSKAERGVLYLQLPARRKGRHILRL